MTLYLKTVTSNIKKGVDCTLGPKTLLVGENGAGKSSVVQAIQLAAEDCVRDGEGRDVIKTYAAISRFFPKGAKKLTASVVLSNDEQELYWELKKTGQSYSKGERKTPVEVVFPFSEVEAVLSGNADSVRAWISKNVIPKLTLSDVENTLTASEWKEVSRMIRRNSLDLDWTVLSASCKKEATSLKREATSASNLVDQMLDGVPAPMQSEDRQKLEDKKYELFNALVAAQAGSVSLEQKRSMYDLILKLSNDLEKLAAQRDAAQKMAGDSDAAYLKELMQVEWILAQHIKLFGDEQCAVCGTGDTKKSIQHRKSVVKFELGLVERAAEAMKLTQAIEALEIDLQEKLEKYQLLVVKDTTTLRNELKDVEDKLSHDTACAQAWANAKNARAEVDAKRKSAEMFASASQKLEEQGEKSLKKSVSLFCDGVNTFMPSGLKFGVDLENARIGLVDGGELHTALSGGEWVSTLLAVSAYLNSKKADQTNSVPVLIPGDRAWHPNLLSRVMDSLTSYEGQVILMSTVAPEVTPKGWTVVELVADEL